MKYKFSSAVYHIGPWSLAIGPLVLGNRSLVFGNDLDYNILLPYKRLANPGAHVINLMCILVSCLFMLVTVDSGLQLPQVL